MILGDFVWSWKTTIFVHSSCAPQDSLSLFLHFFPPNGHQSCAFSAFSIASNNFSPQHPRTKIHNNWKPLVASIAIRWFLTLNNFVSAILVSVWFFTRFSAKTTWVQWGSFVQVALLLYRVVAPRNGFFHNSPFPRCGGHGYESTMWFCCYSCHLLQTSTHPILTICTNPTPAFQNTSFNWILFNTYYRIICLLYYTQASLRNLFSLIPRQFCVCRFFMGHQTLWRRQVQSVAL